MTFVPRPCPPQRRSPLTTSNSDSRIHWSDGGVLVELGGRWRAGDAGVLLDGIRGALARDVPLTLVHRGAGGGSLLRAASVEWPRLRCQELVPGRHASFRPRQPRWTHHRLPAPRPGGEPAGVAISGGLGGIGLELAAHLAAAGHRLWLLDRRPAAGLPAAARRRLAAVAARTQVIVDQADVTAAVPPAPFPITRLVHAAGELDLAPLSEVTGDDLERLAGGKAGGLRSLVDAPALAGLRSVVAFGSTESRRPHRMFGGYALANELLRREAARLREERPGMRVVVAEWSLWSSIGMGAFAAAMAGRAGFAIVPPAWGVQITDLLLDERRTVPDEIVLGGPQPTPDRPLAAITGVGGSSLAMDDASVRRLVELCRPSRAAPHRPVGPDDRVVRAQVADHTVYTWGSGCRDWNTRTPRRQG
ncbi:KR domain-containing protein [Microbispora sp. RL4-1S]|uniref:KR domain-containing protein n=1 Tax=Microbispora oryzae TaxID=2806554 RepID=A0A941AHQ5_9ACTN|nr:KR domain-containing protein [Microbispora oryzae]MBP2702987.1 KR domain-containing protein [Microbispora oryzae]